MLTHEEICSAVEEAAKKYPIKNMWYFGSYASGTQREDSDVDFLVEFQDSVIVGLNELGSLYEDLEEFLKTSVDIITLPLPKKRYFVVQRKVKCYGE
ncbi:MAG: nucleotidyltransferase domain-containing protein [Oscillospiraceae bacterium]|jgi:predicted nucleotidyltransferase|nr:nucleotidyltransferase domain-containing protein [Oscillospiraceae bacterium]